MSAKRTAGYSGKRVADKLGIRAGMRVAVLGVSGDYRRLIGPLPAGVIITTRTSGRADVVHYFAAWRRQLEARIASLARALRDDATLWISWPKRFSGRPTDLTEDVLREVILPWGLVDVKVCAVDHTWSGLKFVRRLHHRRSPPTRSASIS